MKRKTQKLQGIGWTVFSAVMFGFNPLFSKTIYGMGGNPFMITWVRLAVTAVGMMLVFKVIHPEQTSNGRGTEKIDFLFPRLQFYAAFDVCFL